ncbi:uncharacterized protein LOC131300587 isoform X5 [Rhododendron vialii]|uniref:uncharacterized protein LOC131300587 isoform X5 n=1 Tax=Rhododendron vialii TaxID=182163 RepID=UPI00265ED82D|nr:uncharacterized protein LOC131300587 isoform X5 [Rhododendron vialii]
MVGEVIIRNKHMRRPTRRRTRSTKKTKDLKAIVADEFIVWHEMAAQVFSPVLCDGDHPDFENVIYVCHYALQQEEEEFRGRIELKVEWENLNELCSIRDKLKRKPNGSTFLGSIATMMKTYTRNWSMVSRWSSVQT